jgi:glycosyltransferase involved in cell wall biosynthesis
VPSLLRFAQQGLQVTVASFEKPEHLADRAAMAEMARQMRKDGVRWFPLRYHHRPTAPATALDIAHGSARGILAGLRRCPDIIHARTYVGGLMGHLISRTLRRPFIFHNEGFWPDERAESGSWAIGSRAHRATKNLELMMYRRADAVITLSRVAQKMVRELRTGHPPDSTVVVPSCVDLQRFRDVENTPSDGTDCRLVYAGSLGGRYRIADMARFFKAMRREVPSTTLSIYSQSNVEMIRQAMRSCGIHDDWWSVDFVPHSEMPQALGRHNAGLHFLTPGINTRVGSPTKIGEYWAAGLPVVTSPHVGDVDEIVRSEHVGVIVDEQSDTDADASCAGAAHALHSLLQDPELRVRCRNAASQHYSLDTAVSTQMALYRQLAAADTVQGSN